MDTLNPIGKYKRLVIKIGSSLLVDADDGSLHQNWLDSLAKDIDELKQQDYEIVIVSSGAVLLGREILGLRGKKILALEEAQACASAGQVRLAQSWADSLAKYNISSGQILLTPNITEQRRLFLNARTTINTLLKLGAVPIINENDSVATAEIRYGDNDRLSARVAGMIEADCLIILSDIDGLYSSPPEENNKAKHIAHVKEINKQIEQMAGGAASHLARGGMVTKIEAAKITTNSGTNMIICSGVNSHPIRALVNGAKHTLFSAKQNTKAARKRWILGSLELAGRVYIDEGAAKALKKGSSLLPIGVIKIEGDFSRGDAIAIFDNEKREIARGLVGMDIEEAKLAMGKKSEAIIGLFGAKNRTELVHADNLVLIN